MTLDEIARQANKWVVRGQYDYKLVMLPNGFCSIYPPDGWMGLTWVEMAHMYPSIVVLALSRAVGAVTDRMEIRL